MIDRNELAKKWIERLAVEVDKDSTDFDTNAIDIAFTDAGDLFLILPRKNTALDKFNRQF
jgi:hypothetical protein